MINLIFGMISILADLLETEDFEGESSLANDLTIASPKFSIPFIGNDLQLVKIYRYSPEEDVDMIIWEIWIDGERVCYIDPITPESALETIKYTILPNIEPRFEITELETKYLNL